jgi:hypothetical protein
MKGHKRWICGGFLVALACTLWILFGASACVSTRSARDYGLPGLEYRLLEISEPHPNRVHILSANLADNRIRPSVIVAPDPDGDGPADAALTDPLKLAGGNRVLAFINTNPWADVPDGSGKEDRSWYDGQPVIIHGLAVSGGRLRSPLRKGSFSVWIDDTGRLSMGNADEMKSIAEGMGGFQQIVGTGSVIVPTGGPRHPRTAIGADRTGRIMWLVVVDGRQSGYSEGMTLHELAGVMLELGCWNAANMDGGGSSIMGLADSDGVLEVVNRPSGRCLGMLPMVRPLPAILAIKRAPDSER